MKLNKKISSEDLDAAYKNIYDTGLFKNVEFNQSNAGLIITVEEFPTVNDISFEGNRKFTNEKLSSFVESKPRFVLSPRTLEQDIEELQKAYRNLGRVSARIKPKIINLSDNRVDLIFEIYEGSVVEIEKISFVGNRKFSDRRLRRVLSSKQAGLFRKIILKDNLVNEKISLDKKLLTNFYLSRGFNDFKINDVNVELSEETDAFFVTYNITEGPQFVVGEVSLSSNIKELSPENYKDLIKLKPGEVFSPNILEANVSKLESTVQALGFDFVRVEVKITRNISNLSLNLDLKFVMGDKLFIERIDISGNTATLDRVVRRQFFIVEGDPFNIREIKAAEDRIRSLGLFSNTSVNILPGSKESQVVIDVEVVEKPTGSLTFGAGYSSQTGLVESSNM